jgi:hypothetical protein
MQMGSYIFLTDEGYTYQANSESDMPDIENLQVIGISDGENAKEAFYNLMSSRKYLMKTTFDKIFCYKLAKDYKKSYEEFSIKYDYGIEKYNYDEVSFLLTKIKEDMDLDINDRHRVFNAIFDISEKNFLIVKDIIMHEYYCNYYLDVHNYYELHVNLWNDEGLWEDKELHKNLYEFLLKEHNEDELKKRFTDEGWFVSNRFAICLDNNIIDEILNLKIAKSYQDKV